MHGALHGSSQTERPELKSLFFCNDGLVNLKILIVVWDMIEPRGDDRIFQPLNTEEASA